LSNTDITPSLHKDCVYINMYKMRFLKQMVTFMSMLSVGLLILQVFTLHGSNTREFVMSMVFII